MGAKTVLLERNSQLGGTTTTGGVCFPGLFHAWGKQVISGIGWELVTKSKEIDNAKLQDFTVVHKSHVPYHVGINGQLYSLLAEEACLDAGVSLAYYQFPRKWFKPKLAGSSMWWDRAFSINCAVVKSWIARVALKWWACWGWNG